MTDFFIEEACGYFDVFFSAAVNLEL